MLTHSTHLLNSKLGGGGSSLNASQRQLIIEPIQASFKLPAPRSEAAFRRKMFLQAQPPPCSFPAFPGESSALNIGHYHGDEIRGRVYLNCFIRV